MKKKLLLFIGEYFIAFILWLIALSCKKSYKGELLPDEPVVILFWHDRLAFMSFLHKKLRTNTKPAYVIISEHSDGELITRVISHFDLGAVRGSSKQNPVRAMVGALKTLRENNDLVITPDGPRGPRHSISDGCVTIPQKSKAKIIICSYKSSSSWFFKSWDKMELPKPFSKVEFQFSKPFSIENLSLEVAKEKIAEEFAKIGDI